MSLSWRTWSQRVIASPSAGKGRSRKGRRQRAGLLKQLSERPQLEALERRDLPSGTWQFLNSAPPGGVGIGTMMLLSDGSVMAEEGGLGSGVRAYKNWYRLTPDASGSYVNGSWSQLASMSLERLYFASNVLPDGRVLVVGGEYSGPNNNQNDTNTGEIYDPVANRWSAIAPFSQSQFGDDPSEMLPDGRVLAGYLSGPQTYIYDPAANRWTATGNKLRNDNSDEETWVMLPDHSILSYDVCTNDPAGCTRGHAQLYRPSSGTWVDAGTAPNNLTNANVGYEMGPGLRLQDGRIFFIGATNHTALYTPSSSSWVSGPDVPNGQGADDAPGAVLPNGHVLFAVDTPKFNPPTNIYDYDPGANTITQVQLPSSLSLFLDIDPAFNTRMLMLPSGQVLFTYGASQLWVYTPNEGSNGFGRPAVSSIGDSLNDPRTLVLTGTQLNGISEGASYGDDAEMSSNYPLVQVRTAGSNTVAYARTFNWSNTGIATGSTPESVAFTLPANYNRGFYLVNAVANGIVSPTVLNLEMTSTTENLIVRNDPNNSANVQVVNGNNNTVIATYVLSSINSIAVSCDSGTDTLTVDYHYGNPLPAGGLDYESGGGTDTLNVNDQNSNANQTFLLGTQAVQRGTGAPEITFNGGGISFVNINGGSGNNTYNIEGTAVLGTTTIHTGTGTDTVNVRGTGALGALVINGDALAPTVNVGSTAPNLQGTLTRITAPVTVTNSSGPLNVDDSGDTTSRTGTVSATSVTGLGMGGAGSINYNGSSPHLSALTVRGGSGTNTITVTGTSSTTTIIAGVGGSASTVNVRAASNPLTVDGNASFSTVNIGSQAPNLNGTLANITAPVTVTNTSGSLNVDDSGDGNTRSGTVSATAVTGLGFGSGGSVNYNAASPFVGALTVRGGSATNTIAVTGTSSPTTIYAGANGGVGTVNVRAASSLLTIDGGAAASTVNVGSQAPNLSGTLANITAPITVRNSSGPLNVDDSGDNRASGGTISGVAVNGLGLGSGGAINYDGSSPFVSSLTFHGGSGGNSITLTGTSTGTTVYAGSNGGTVNVKAAANPLTIDGGAANSTVNVGTQAPNLNGTLAGISAPVTVVNSSGPLNVDDSGDTTGRSGTVSATALTGLGMSAGGSINYDGSSPQVSALTVWGGSGGAAVTVSGTSTSTTVNGNPAGTNSLTGPDTTTTWNVTGSNAGSISALNLSFSGFQNLSGGAGFNDFTFLDGATLSGSLTGGGGSNTLDTSFYSTNESFSITGANAGTATVVPVFTNIQNLFGSGAATTFSLSDGGSLDGFIHGANGVATLDYSNGWTGDVVVNLKLGLATAVGGGVFNITDVNGANGGGAGFYNILIGNGGNTLTGGNGRRNLLEAGRSASTLVGGNDDDILIGGTTAYDGEADAHDFIAIMNYWANTADDYATRVGNLLNGNGVPALNASTVSNNGGGNTMLGNNGGPSELNLFYGLDPTLETTDYNLAAGEQFINV